MYFTWAAAHRHSAATSNPANYVCGNADGVPGLRRCPVRNSRNSMSGSRSCADNAVLFSYHATRIVVPIEAGSKQEGC